MSTITYTIGKNLYINITNKCTNNCTFCIRSKTKKLNKKYDLWLDHEPAAQEILSQIDDPGKYEEVVFCGYGEPLINLEIVKEVSKELKKKGCHIRVDSNGHANLYHKRNIIPELVGLIDKISISLNAQDKETYQHICHSIYGEEAYEEVINFAKKCKVLLPAVQFSVVHLPEVDIDKCKNIADNLGIELKVRKYYEEDYAGFNNNHNTGENK